MKVLFIGGTGIISSACSRQALAKGIELYHLNRGRSGTIRPVDGAKLIQADINDIDSVQKELGDRHFDVVVDWVAFHPDDIRRDIRLFSGRTDQYVFISSASVYQTPPETWPVTESTPVGNPFWLYSRNKIACEEVLHREGRETGFPYTVIRPSHTYDRTLLPLEWGYAVMDRMKKGKEVIVHGDGSSLWTLTHHEDFAVAFTGLLSRSEAVGETYHITSDFFYSWDHIVKTLADVIGVEARIVHVPSDVIARYDPEVGSSLLGDKTHSMIFDNSKIKALVPEYGAQIPFEHGAKEIISWYEEDVARQVVDPRSSAIIEKILSDWNQDTTS